LTIRSDGTIYFSDPDFQAPSPDPQSAQRLYRVPPGGQPAPEAAVTQQPNGVTLSPDEKTLYVSGSGQLSKFAVMTDGSLGTGSNFLMSGQGKGDGMAVDCAGNLYVSGVDADLHVYSPAGMEIGTIIVGTGGDKLQSTTNVAFGGTDHKTLYITGLGNTRGLFKIALNVSGKPY
jgi:gluconolactonase